MHRANAGDSPSKFQKGKQRQADWKLEFVAPDERLFADCMPLYAGSLRHREIIFILFGLCNKAILSCACNFAASARTGAQGTNECRDGRVVPSSTGRSLQW